MKYIPALAVLLALSMLAIPSFAAAINAAPNPSFEIPRDDNSSIPLTWYRCVSTASLCSSDDEAWGNTSRSSDFSIDGSNSFKLASDFDRGTGNGAVTVSTAPNETSLPAGTYNLSFYWKIVGTITTQFKFNLVNSSYDSFRWYAQMSAINGTYSAGGSSAYFVDGSPTAIGWDTQSVGGGWYKTNISVVSPYPLTPQYSMHTQDNQLDTLTYVDNISLSYEEAATPPIVAIQNPANDSVISISMDFVAYALQYTAESATIDSCWYSLNGLPNVTMPACANGTGYPNLNPFDLENQTVNSVTVYANDTSGNIGSATSTFNISIVHPTVGIISPSGDYNVDTASFSQNLAGWRIQCGFRIDNESLNMSIGCTDGTIWLPQGSHNITAQAWNNQGNYANSTASFFVDSSSPIVSIQSPTGTLPSPYNVSYTTDEANLGFCWYSTDGGSNTTIPSCANFTDTASTGSHNITIYANDTLGNIGSATGAFTVSAPFVPPHTGMVTGVTAGIYMLFPMLLGLLILLLAIYMLMSGHADIKEAAVMIIVGIIMIIAATSIMASFL
jgi:hypothetical protein